MNLAYYNEINDHAAHTLRNLIDAGHIAPGIVDTRSIEDVHPADLRGFTQCHFFAGVGVWSYALRRAGWADDRPVWTGSCPCQPFSTAGKGAGFTDERHLWPAFHHLIKECKAATVFGEQVASKDADPWIDLVQTDLETLGYAFGAVPFPSAGVGAPHIRDRLYWVADLQRKGLEKRARFAGVSGQQAATDTRKNTERGSVCGAGGMEHAGQNHDAGEVQAACDGKSQTDRPANIFGRSGVSSCGLADDQRQRVWAAGPGITLDASGQMQGEFQERQRFWTDACTSHDGMATGSPTASPTNGFWRAADWLFCRDGKWRPVEPGTFPLAHGAPARVGRLRAYGNAINAQAAQIFIESCMK